MPANHIFHRLYKAILVVSSRLVLLDPEKLRSLKATKKNLGFLSSSLMVFLIYWMQKNTMQTRQEVETSKIMLTVLGLDI